MKKLMTAAFVLAFCSIAHSQTDSIKRASFALRPYIEGGAAFIQNSFLKDAYKTNSMFFWSIGVRIGDARLDNVLPYIQISRAAHNFKSGSGAQTKDTTLAVNEFNFGFQFPAFRFGEQMLRAKVAGAAANIEDDINKNQTSGFGMQLGLAFENKLGKRSRLYIDYSYDLIKYEKGNFRDYDLGKLSAGIIF